MRVLKSLSILAGNYFRPSSSIWQQKYMSSFSTIDAWAPNKSIWRGNLPDSVADVLFVPMFSDNYGYLLVDPDTQSVACVDPGDGQAILRAVTDSNLKLTTILATHKHADHVGGNVFLKDAVPGLEVIAGKYEEIPGATKLVADGDVFEFGGLVVRTCYTPCHTKGHIVYHIERKNPHPQFNRPILFCGDTLFAGGCGRFFEGTAEQMQRNMELFATLPPATQVFCAHEYTESNYKFLVSIDREICGEKYEEVQGKRRRGEPTLPSTIAEEMKYNLFMHCHTPSLQSKLGTSNPVDTMAEIRLRKNNF
jgi:hydroxyacylglutathione hydrolase